RAGLSETALRHAGDNRARRRGEPENSGRTVLAGALVIQGVQWRQHRSRTQALRLEPKMAEKRFSLEPRTPGDVLARTRTATVTLVARTPCGGPSSISMPLRAGPVATMGGCRTTLPLLRRRNLPTQLGISNAGRLVSLKETTKRRGRI